MRCDVCGGTGHCPKCGGSGIGKSGWFGVSGGRPERCDECVDPGRCRRCHGMGDLGEEVLSSTDPAPGRDESLMPAIRAELPDRPSRERPGSRGSQRGPAAPGIHANLGEFYWTRPE
jgi:hypothetical protein